ncbi:MAG: type II secretion system protein M [Rhodanobacter sp.]
MKARVIHLWESRSPRERVIIAVLAALVGVLLYVALVLSAERATTSLKPRVVALRGQAARLEQQAVAIESLRAAPAISVSQTDLRALVQAQTDSAGLAHALVSINAPGVNQVVVVFGAVPFADWLRWVAALEVQHVRLDTCRIEALSTPGLVSVTATLVRPKPR